MPEIGIVGSGIGGLHLALFLQQHGVVVTMYSDKSPEQIRNSRLPNTPARFQHTIERERILGVNHWDRQEFELHGMNFYVGGEYPINFRADLAEPASFVDPRLYTSVLLEDFQARGGQVVVGALDASQVAALSEMHDLLVVASGRGSLIQMFPRIPEYSPYTAPQRILAAGYWAGFVEVDPHYMSFVIAPGHGEIFQGSLASFGRYQHNLLFEGIPGQGFEILNSVRYEDNPRRYADAALEVLRTHAPTIYERIDPAEFRPTGPLDVIQGAITPTVREGYVALDNGKFVMALGDVHISNDPIAGQGVNTASHSAWVLGEAILDGNKYDEAFCQAAEQAMLDYALPVTEWSNALLMPPPPHMVELLISAAQVKPLADAFASNFNDPVKQWSILSNPERTAEFIGEYAALAVA